MAQLNDDQLASIAHDFYLSKLNIAEIAQKYSLSRYLVTKALDDAQERGVVRINITHGIKRNQILEREMQKRFGLKEAIILPGVDNNEIDNIIAIAAKQIEIHLKSAKAVGVSWGSTMHSVIDSFNDANFPDLHVVQLLGQAINSNRRKNPLTQEAAEKLHARSLMLPAPMYVLNPQIVSDLEKEPYFKAVKQCYRELDLLFTGIGTLQSFKVNPFLVKNYGPTLLKGIPEEDIAGFILGRPYNIQGKFFDSIEKYVCGISMTDIMNTPVRFCIVQSRFKSTALLGALRSGIVTHLVTSENIAERILAYHN